MALRVTKSNLLLGNILNKELPLKIKNIEEEFLSIHSICVNNTL